MDIIQERSTTDKVQRYDLLSGLMDANGDAFDMTKLTDEELLGALAHIVSCYKPKLSPCMFRKCLYLSSGWAWGKLGDRRLSIQRNRGWDTVSPDYGAYARIYIRLAGLIPRRAGEIIRAYQICDPRWQQPSTHPKPTCRLQIWHCF